MAEFIKIGRRRIQVAEIREVTAPLSSDGDVLVHYADGHCEPVSRDDGEILLAWTDANLVQGQQPKPKQTGKATA